MVILLLTQGFKKIIYTYFADNSTYEDAYIKAKDLMIQYPEASCFEILTETQYNVKFMSENFPIKKENRIYAFAGRKRSGKSELANFMCEKYGAIKITIASYLKQLCADLLECDLNYLNQIKDDGTTFTYKPNEKWFKIINNETNIPIDVINKEIGNIVFTSVRQMLQVIGTNLIRKYYPDWHVNKMIKDIKSYNNKIIVIDDVRFVNEKNAIAELGGEIFFIIRTSNCLNVSNHISEISLTWDMFDNKHIIINNSDTNSLLTKFDKIYTTPSYVDEDVENNVKSKFGIEKTNLVNHIVSLIKNDTQFDKNGVIKVTIESHDILPLLDETCKSTIITYNEQNGEFIIDNPFIIENFKMHLN